MNKRTIAWGLAALLWGAAQAAPVVSDQDPAWVRDAVATLAAKGLVEGYPDGTFKGDRAASRWEVAMIVARLLARMEQEHATFATKAELEELRKLTDALREELDALGVRVQNLDENVGRLDKRVTDLERIQFYGSIETRVGAQGVHNVGSPAQGTVFNYQAAVGTAEGASGPIQPPSPLAGSPWGPPTLGVFPVADLALGRPMTSGSTFTSKAILGIQANVSEDVSAGLELASYISMGDRFVDAYYGVQAPYLSNPFLGTLGAGAGPQGLNNQPFTRLTLDNFWVEHKPSHTNLRLGSFSDTRFDRSIYKTRRSPNTTNFTTPFFFGGEEPGLDSYGARLRGDVVLNDDLTMQYEGMGTFLPQSLNPITGTSYRSHAYGANVALLFDEERGKARLNFLRAGDEAINGAPLQTGLIFTPNQFLSWVNPNGFYRTQLGAGPQVGGVGSSTDIRPISQTLPVDGDTGLPGFPIYGGVGPQRQDSFGLDFRYALDNEVGPRFTGQVAHTNYRPNQFSTYTTDGTAWRLAVDASLLDQTLDLAAEYLYVDPRFDPYLTEYSETGIGLVKLRVPFFDQLPSLDALHDSRLLPFNRQGFRTSARYWFSEKGQIKVQYGRLTQVATSVPDVRFSASSLAPGTPDVTVFGYSPGFIDLTFSPVSRQTFAGAGANTLGGAPLENYRGIVNELEVDGAQAFDLDEERQVKLSGIFLRYNYFRDSHLSSLVPGAAGIAGENLNYLDATYQGFLGRVDYDVTRDFSMYVAYTKIDLFGHFDSSGVYSPFAVASGNPRYPILDITQHAPELGGSWDIDENVSVNALGRLLFNIDNVDPRVLAAPNVAQVNVFLPPQTGTHPFSWNAWQVLSTVNVKL